MKVTRSRTRISFEFPDQSAAMKFAQRIANACGGTVTVVGETGEDIARAKPKHMRLRSVSVASIQQLVDDMKSTKH